MVTPGVDYIGISVPFVCHDGKGRYLLHKRSQKCRDEKGVWDFGGGKLEFGETPIQAVLREIKEEYGVLGQIERELPAYSLFRTHDDKKSHWIIIPFIVKVDHTKVINNDPEKISQLKWCKLDNLPSPLHPGVLKILESIR